MEEEVIQHVVGKAKEARLDSVAKLGCGVYMVAVQRQFQPSKQGRVVGFQIGQPSGIVLATASIQTDTRVIKDAGCTAPIPARVHVPVVSPFPGIVRGFVKVVDNTVEAASNLLAHNRLQGPVGRQHFANRPVLHF